MPHHLWVGIGIKSLDEAVLLAHPKPNSELPRKDSDTALTQQEVDILEMKKKSSQKVQELIINLEALEPKECKLLQMKQEPLEDLEEAHKTQEKDLLTEDYK